MSNTNSPDNIPQGYTILRKVGEGQAGQVVLALPTSIIDLAHNARKKQTEDKVIDFAMPKVVAIKKATDTRAGTAATLANERRILNAIQSQADSYEGSSNIVKLLGADTSLSPRWLTMSTMPLCCDLHALVTHASEPIPSGLVWHVFAQLYHAIYFLQKACDPCVKRRG
jgi:serine/threonine protein kinase